MATCYRKSTHSIIETLFRKLIWVHMQGLQVGSVDCTSKNVLPDKEKGFPPKVVFPSYKQNTVRLES